MISSETIMEVMGAPEKGIIEKSYNRIENVAIFFENAYISYAIYMGNSHYCGTVDYRDITIQ